MIEENMESSEIVQDDQVMNTAKKEWHGGIAVLAIFLILVTGVAWGYFRTTKISVNQPVSETVSQQSPEPSVVPTVETKPVFSVLNASGVTGAAGKLAELIKQVESERLHFIESEAEEIHGPLYSVPQTQNGSNMLMPELYPESSGEIMTPPAALEHE